MASPRVSIPTAASTDPRLDAYLADVARRLHGPRRRRQQILVELCDGLDEATEGYVTSGLSRDQAAHAAIAEFGAPDAVADAFAGELGTAYARHTIASFLATGPLVGAWWLLLLQPHPWLASLTALLGAIPVIPVIAIAIATAAGTFATTGRMMRWLPEAGPRRALTATIAITALCLIADIAMICSFVLSGTPLRPLALVAITASLVRMACSSTALGRASRCAAAIAVWMVSGTQQTTTGGGARGR